jgi:CheY-like chemotaxis protein
VTTEQLRVVIIDDSKADVAVIRRFLTRPGEREFEIGIAHSGAAGIALLQEARPDCILLDYRLPDMTGLDILTRLRHDLQMHTVPVVMLTGSSDESLVVQALKHGAQDYLSKDNLSAENLLRAIFNSIEKIEVMRRLEDALLSRDEFLSIASHELKTPLTTMTLQLQIGLQLMEGAYGNRERHDTSSTSRGSAPAGWSSTTRSWI